MQPFVFPLENQTDTSSMFQRKIASKLPRSINFLRIAFKVPKYH